MPSLIITALVILAFYSPTTLGQTMPKATMIERCDPQCSHFHGEVDETALTLRLLEPPTEIAVLRVCSNQSMAFALGTAAMNPREYADWIITRLGYPPERILFLRSEDCRSPNPEVTAAELWAVPKGSELPAHVELLKSCQFRIKALGAGRRGANGYDGAANYRAALRRLIAKLRVMPNTAGVVRGYYLEHPTRTMKRAIRESQSLIGQSGLPGSRYKATLEIWAGEDAIYPMPDREPNYPTVYLAEVLKDCDHGRVSATPQSNNPLDRSAGTSFFMLPF